MKVVEDLRQQASDVDRVRGRQREGVARLRIAKHRLDQALAVVEGTRHAHREHLVAQRRELPLLTLAHLAFRKQHHHARPRQAQEGVRHSPAGVARCRDHDRQWRSGAPQPRHQAAHEARPHILECECGAVEQLQHMGARAQRNQGQREAERLPHRRPKHLVLHLFAEEMAGDGEAAPHGVRASEGVDLGGGKRTQRFGHVEPAIRSQTPEQSLAERDGGGAARRAYQLQRPSDPVRAPADGPEPRRNGCVIASRRGIRLPGPARPRG